MLRKKSCRNIYLTANVRTRAYTKRPALCFYCEWLVLYKSSSTSMNMGSHLFYLICESSINKTIIITMKFISKNNTRNILHEIWVTRLVTLVLSCHPLQPNFWAWRYFGYGSEHLKKNQFLRNMFYFELKNQI